MTYKGIAEFRKNAVKALSDVAAAENAVDVISDNSYFVFPGFIDVHVHLREPGFFYKESIASGTAAAAHGGYTSVCSMPNLDPVPDCMENLKAQINIIKKDAVINVFPYATVTKGEKGKIISDMRSLAPYVIAFSDDGRGVQSAEIMFEAMQTAKLLNKIIAAHCEDDLLRDGGYINDCEYAHINGHRGICNESEWRQIERDIELVRKTGCAYHICHISTKESVELIRDAKKDGLDITCETAPHYLLLDDGCLREDGDFKMNPPLRSYADREALLGGIIDGTIDMIATDHAPHSKDEKSGGLKDSLMGITGLETAFPLLYTNLVKRGIISLEKLIELMSINPAKRFGIPLSEKSFCVWDLNREYSINTENFLSKGKSTPFKGWKVFGECIMTVLDGKTVYQK